MARTHDRHLLSARITDGHGQLRQLRWQIRLTCVWIAVLALVAAQTFLRPGERSVVDAVPGLLAMSVLADTAAGTCLRSWGRLRGRGSLTRGN